MADVRESFPSLEGASAEGLALRAVVEGDSAAAKNGSLGFSFKDSSGNAVLPQLNSLGQIRTTSNVPGNGIYARGTVGGSLTLVTVATLTLTTSTMYENLDFVISCFRDAVFNVIWNDNGAETILADGLCGPGQPSFNGKLSELEFTSGASGTQQILIKALNLNATSDFRASVSVRKVS